jgi:hypothetical protein
MINQISIDSNLYQQWTNHLPFSMPCFNKFKTIYQAYQAEWKQNHQTLQDLDKAFTVLPKDAVQIILSFLTSSEIFSFGCQVPNQNKACFDYLTIYITPIEKALAKLKTENAFDKSRMEKLLKPIHLHFPLIHGSLQSRVSLLAYRCMNEMSTQNLPFLIELLAKKIDSYYLAKALHFSLSCAEKKITPIKIQLILNHPSIRNLKAIIEEKETYLKKGANKIHAVFQEQPVYGSYRQLDIHLEKILSSYPLPDLYQQSFVSRLNQVHGRLIVKLKDSHQLFKAQDLLPLLMLLSKVPHLDTLWLYDMHLKFREEHIPFLKDFFKSSPSLK